MPPSNPPPYGQPPPPYGQQPPGPAGQPQPMPYPPPPPPMPFQGPPPGLYPPPPNAPKTTNWWAVVSLIFGVIGGVLISVICGIVGLNKAKQGQGGRGMAIAGLVLSGLWVLVAIAAVAIYFIVGKG